MKRWRALSGWLPSAGQRVLTLEWAKEARDDLADIQPSIEQRNPQAAADLLDTIKRGAELLTFVPLAFRAGRVLHGKRRYP